MNELKPEEVMKALECCKGGGNACLDCIYFYKSVDTSCAPFLIKDALALLREKDALIADYIRQIAEMQRKIACKDDLITFLEKHKKAEADKDAEIERLKNRIICQVILPDEKLEEIKNECLERVELDIKEIKADTVRKMQSEIKERCIKGGIYPAFVKNTIDQIAKEMLEGKDAVHSD